MIAYRDKITTDHIRELVGHDPELIVEIGANDGDDTLKFLNAFPKCKVVAFEPDPRAIDAFESVMMKAGIYSERCALIKAAVADTDGYSKLFMSSGPRWRGRDWDLSSSICRPTRHLERSPEINFDAQTDVRVVKLDSVEELAGKTIDFIWCDPQGAQAKIIAGGKETLARTRWLYIEYYDKPLYADEPTLLEIRGLLPGWTLMATYENENALFRNDA